MPATVIGGVPRGCERGRGQTRGIEGGGECMHVETLLSSRVPEIPEIDNESAGNEYGPVSLSGAP